MSGDRKKDIIEHDGFISNLASLFHGGPFFLTEKQIEQVVQVFQHVNEKHGDDNGNRMKEHIEHFAVHYMHAKKDNPTSIMRLDGESFLPHFAHALNRLVLAMEELCKEWPK